ncbi:hypothetical protein Taro_003993 [Colocasia esculenta]|uniref:Uncharacterized protein n=1 Tax=Colocasia esculenta TaxID=4460 RepID=A0A843TIT1_COLES|nr:hypothetical protein [Colocasia esculenta]
MNAASLMNARWRAAVALGKILLPFGNCGRSLRIPIASEATKPGIWNQKRRRERRGTPGKRLIATSMKHLIGRWWEEGILQGRQHLMNWGLGGERSELGLVGGRSTVSREEESPHLFGAVVVAGVGDVGMAGVGSFSPFSSLYLRRQSSSVGLAFVFRSSLPLPRFLDASYRVVVVEDALGVPSLVGSDFSAICGGKIMRCLCSRQQVKMDGGVSESMTSRDSSVGDHPSHTDEADQRVDVGNIEEAESSLREGGCLNYEEARALLGRMEYNRGNIEAALRVFDGIDVAAIVPKMKLSISRRAELHKIRSRRHYSMPPMSMHAVSLLFEAIFLKAKSLQHLQKFREAAQLCSTMLDAVESALPEGLPENFGADCKLLEMLNRAVELLPELWKLAGFSEEAISSYRRALHTTWNLGADTIAKLQKEFAIFLLYGGCDASPPNLHSQMDASFIPKNNIEEAVLLLMILLRKFSLRRVQWDPSIVDHLMFALSVSGELNALARQVEELLPGVMDRKQRYYTLALCYLSEGDDMIALNFLKKILSAREDPNCLKALLLASKICGENNVHAEEGVQFARRALANLDSGCELTGSVANLLLGISLSTHARSSASDSERIARQYEALTALEKADKIKQNDYKVVYYLSLENADQRKLDPALCYAKLSVKLEAGSNAKSWILLAQILSAQKCYLDAETVINVALDQTYKWGHGELLRTKARIQIAQGQLNNAIGTYTQLLAVLQLRNKSIGFGMKLLKGRNGKKDTNLELETWYDLANVYTSMAQWNDTEICLSKLKSISPFSALSWHATGQLYEAKGLHREALAAYRNAIEAQPTHVPSLVSTAIVLRRLGDQSVSITKGFLTDALRLDRTNYAAWFNLGGLYLSEGSRSAIEAAECFRASALLEESAPVEAFR